MLLAVLCLTGCAHAPRENLPTYKWTDSQTALNTLADRAASVKSVQSEGFITLVRPDTHETVRLDGALALQPPDNARLRAWKLGQAIFDLTITPAGAWVVMPSGHKDEMMPAGQNASQFLRKWSSFLGELFRDEGLVVDDNRGGKRFTVSRPMKDGTLACEVDRATLTPRVYRFLDAEKKTRFTLTLDEYKAVDGVPWPTKLVAKGDGAPQVTVEMRGVELNGDISPKAFVPPKRAEKLP